MKISGCAQFTPICDVKSKLKPAIQKVIALELPHRAALYWPWIASPNGLIALRSALFALMGQELSQNSVNWPELAQISPKTALFGLFSPLFAPNSVFFKEIPWSNPIFRVFFLEKSNIPCFFSRKIKCHLMHCTYPWIAQWATYLLLAVACYKMLLHVVYFSLKNKTNNHLPNKKIEPSHSALSLLNNC